MRPSDSTPRPRADQIADVLRHELVRRRWSIGHRLPSTRAIAERYGTGLRTVGDALAILAEEELVTVRPGSGTYVKAWPSVDRRDEPETWGVLIPNTGYFGHTIDGIEVISAEAGSRLILATSRYDTARELTAVRKMVRGGVSGLIIAPTECHHTDDPMWSQLLAEITVPTVFIERVPPPSGERPISYVISDIRAGVAAAVQHLTSHRRRRIGFFGPRLSIREQPMLEGFVDGLHAAGLSLEPGAVVAGEESVAVPDYAQRVEALGLDAVFVVWRGHAMQLIDTLRRSGVRVPDTVAVMGQSHYDTDLADTPLSGLQLPRRDIGLMAGSVLRQLMWASDSPTVCHVRCIPRLRLQESCGCPSTIDDQTAWESPDH